VSGAGLLAEHGETLIGVAQDAIRHGLEGNGPLAIDPTRYPPPLRERRASFVTLHAGGQLRGCTGHLEATQPLVADVARSAHQAAFADPRFPPLAASELARIEIHVSVLGPLEPLAAASEEELLRALRPGEDGLLLREGLRQATFLPAVWKTLPEPGAFVAELKRKAGLAEWSRRIECFRYGAESFPTA
jgi:AmmeMemoRadiSam system protein A